MQKSRLLLLPAFLYWSSTVKAYEVGVDSGGMVMGTKWLEAMPTRSARSGITLPITSQGGLVRAEPPSHTKGQASLPSQNHKASFVDKVNSDDDSVHMFEEACRSPRATPLKKWDAMSAMARALNSLDAPYNIHGGTILGLVRGCYIFDYDIDYAVEREWLEKNLDKTVSTILAGGFFEKESIFGDPKQVGYERSFRSHPSGAGSLLQVSESSAAHAQLKATFQASLRQNHTIQLHRDGIKVDLFTVQRKSDHYEWGLWTHENGAAKFNPCTVKSTGTAKFSWLGVDVKVPVPVKDVLISLYGADYMTPREWGWNVEPFTIGSCRHA